MGQPVREGEAGGEREGRRGREQCFKQKGCQEAKKLRCPPVLSLAGVREEGGKWQKVGWLQAICGISVQLCVHICIYVYIHVCVFLRVHAHTIGTGEGHIGNNSPSDACKKVAHFPGKSGDVNLHPHFLFPVC